MRLKSLLLCLIPLLALGELGLHQYFARRAPDFPDYALLAPRLLKLKQAGMPVVVSPAWAEPLVRQAAPKAFPLAELARPDDRGFASFLEVSLLGQSAPELATFRLERSERVGTFQLAIKANPQPVPTLFDFVDAVEAGEVEVFTELDAQLTPCPLRQHQRTETGGLHGHVAYPRERFECRSGRFVGVGIIEDENYRPRRCVLTQVPDEGALLLRFTAAPTSKQLSGFGGFSYFLERDVQRDEVVISVNEAQTPLGEYRAAGARGWSHFELARAAVRGVLDVRLRRLARKSGDFCFALEAR